MKSLDDIMSDMSKLYDQVDDGTKELKVASEQANIAGKYLKAYQLQLAREIFTDSKRGGSSIPIAAPDKTEQLAAH